MPSSNMNIELDTCKQITTKGVDGEPNGFIIELFKDKQKTTVYMNVLYPKAFRGYHIHTTQTNSVYCIQGEVVVNFKIDGEIKVIPLSANDYQRLIIPPQIPTGFENMGVNNAVLIIMPVPAYDPANTGEAIPVIREVMEKSDITEDLGALAWGAGE